MSEALKCTWGRGEDPLSDRWSSGPAEGPAVSFGFVSGLWLGPVSCRRRLCGIELFRYKYRGATGDPPLVLIVIPERHFCF